MANPTDAGDSGYRKPPKDSQFQKGVSGNPKGRPKKLAAFKADLAAELKEKVVINENGKPRRVTKQRALIKTLTVAAISKDIRAVNVLFALIKFFGVEPENEIVESVDANDLDELENYIARERRRATTSGFPEKRRI